MSGFGPPFRGTSAGNQPPKQRAGTTALSRCRSRAAALASLGACLWVRWDWCAAGFSVRAVAPCPAVLVLSTSQTHVVAEVAPVRGGLYGAGGVSTGAQVRGPFQGCLGPFRCAQDGCVHVVLPA